MPLTFTLARSDDAEELAQLRSAVSAWLTKAYGHGHWSGNVSAPGVLRGINESQVIVCRDGARVVGTARLAKRKPWAIDPLYFTAVKRPLYLVDMAVAPDFQRQGIGRSIVAEAVRVASEFPADAIWLDAYDSPAGAGPFYAKCGFTEAGRKAYRGVPLVYYELLLGEAGVVRRPGDAGSPRKRSRG